MKKHRHEWGKINIEVSVDEEVLEKIQEKFPNINDDLGAKYLGVFSSRSLKTREKYISFALLVLLSLYIF